MILQRLEQHQWQSSARILRMVLNIINKYEVLGRVHTFMAKQQLIKEDPENPFFKVALADVYVRLTDEALRLVQWHNNSHFVHKITHQDLVNDKCIYLSKKHSRSIILYTYRWIG